MIDFLNALAVIFAISTAIVVNIVAGKLLVEMIFNKFYMPVFFKDARQIAQELREEMPELLFYPAVSFNQHVMRLRTRIPYPKLKDMGELFSQKLGRRVWIEMDGTGNAIVTVEEKQ